MTINKKHTFFDNTTFTQSINIIQKYVSDIQKLVFGEKLTLAFLTNNEREHASKTSISVHGSEINSNEVIEKFSEMLEFGDAGLKI